MLSRVSSGIRNLGCQAVTDEDGSSERCCCCSDERLFFLRDLTDKEHVERGNKSEDLHSYRFGRCLSTVRQLSTLSALFSGRRSDDGDDVTVRLLS